MNGTIVSKFEIIKKITKIALKVLYKIFIIFCIMLIAIVVMQRFSNNNKSILGYRIFRVITGSMEPEYDIGEVVISKEINPEDIKVGDDIVYIGKNGEYTGKIIMHKVIAIDKDENNVLNFHAKGLHSSSMEDSEIKSEQIYGIVKYRSTILSWLYKLATNIYSLFIIVIVLILNIFISFIDEKNFKMKQLSAECEIEEKEDIEELDCEKEEVINEKEDDI